ncbi:hypothetical protein HG530_000434 [Fusarium avenaceum]|nr:hypothetical protein HG530_000434 [Fusarium avenaceum]
MGTSLLVDLPLSDGVEGLLPESLVLDDFPAGPEDGEDLNGHDRDGEPREVDITRLDSTPVEVEQDNSSKRQRKLPNPQHGHVATTPEEVHATGDDKGPDEGEDDPEDAQAIEPGLRRGRSVGLGHCSVQ